MVEIEQEVEIEVLPNSEMVIVYSPIQTILMFRLLVRESPSPSSLCSTCDEVRNTSMP